MEQCDWDLLEKQTQRLSPSRNEGVLGLTVAAMFFGGLVLGALFSHQSERMRTASNDAAAEISLPNGALVERDTHYYR